MNCKILDSVHHILLAETANAKKDFAKVDSYCAVWQKSVVGKDTFFLYLDKIHILCQIKYLDTIQILFWPMYLDKIQIQILIHGLLKPIHFRYIFLHRYYSEIRFCACITEEHWLENEESHTCFETVMSEI